MRAMRRCDRDVTPATCGDSTRLAPAARRRRSSATPPWSASESSKGSAPPPPPQCGSCAADPSGQTGIQATSQLAQVVKQLVK
jgi:hypothetical protein